MALAALGSGEILVLCIPLKRNINEKVSMKLLTIIKPKFKRRHPSSRRMWIYYIRMWISYLVSKTKSTPIILL